MSANSSILGDSWVVEAAASPTPRKHKNKHEAGSLSQLSGSPAPRAPVDQTKNPQSPRDTKTHGHGSESTATSVSSISGPELIMPSIYETPVPEASWIVPNVRPSRQTVKRRHPGPAREDDRSSEAPNQAPNTSPDRTEEDKGRQKHHPKHTNKRTLIHRLQPTARILLNALLAAAIAHLLVLPELITQHQSILCAIPAIPSLYPTSCAPHALFTGPVASSRHNNKSKSNIPQPTREEQLTQLASHLERLFTQTLTNLTPLSPLLKQSDSRLRTLQTELHASFPGRRNELDLEFSGLWEAARTGVRKFDSLRADLQSAVDNLIATTGANTPQNNNNDNGERAKNKITRGEGGGEHETSNANANAKAQARIAQITSAQLSRRENYLDQLTSRMQDKADALASDLATVEDHLESIEGIILREERQGQGQGQGQGWRVQRDSPSSSTSSSTSTSGKARAEAETNTIPLISRLLALRHSLSSVRQARSDRSARETLVAATTGHRAVAEAVRNLSQRLEAVQRRKTS